MRTARTILFALSCSLFFLVPSPGASQGEGGPPGGEPRGLHADDFRGLELRNIGPALMSGRIADLDVDPRRRSTWYASAGSGGVWKSLNAGMTWTPIFDHQGSYSIGCSTLDPSHPDTLWVGTGENSSGRHVGWGDGVYRSDDGGQSWRRMGLVASEHIAEIVVDPRDSDVVWVAAEGPLWNRGGERGVYKTTDGGETWRRVLFVDDDTGATSLAADPRDPDVLYAATYQRRRHVWSFLSGGPGSGIHRSTDGGETWTRLAGGLPTGDLGKIGLAVSPVDPDYVYATIEASADPAAAGFWRSTDRGASWQRRNAYLSGGTGPHYYQEIWASPSHRDRVYQADVWLHYTDDGGATFAPVGEPDKHSDNHALVLDPADPDHLLVGSDGGIYETFDHGRAWRFVPNLPLTQFYKVAVDGSQPFYDVAGGTQDNGTQVGPSRTPYQHGIRNQDWVVAVAADGYDCAFDSEDPRILYGEWQRGGLVRFDRQTGEGLEIQPKPAPGDPPERWNWDAPLEPSPHAPGRLYFGSQRLWRSDDRGHSWQPISGDLSRGRARYEMPIDERVRSIESAWDNRAMSWYATTTTISESPVEEGLLYVGTDDGLVQISEDGGSTWRRSGNLPGVPELAFVNELKASPHSADTVFALFDAHKLGDFRPLVLRSDDRGRSWRSIAGDLPARHVAWSIVQDPVRADLLFLGTEFGLFTSFDGGDTWSRFAGGMPTIALRDLELQTRVGDLVAGSFGRGIYILDDLGPLRAASVGMLEAEATLFPVRRAWLYVEERPLGVRDRGVLGSDEHLAENPPFGALLTVHLRDDVETAADRRRARETEWREQGVDVPFPGWQRLRLEEREIASRWLVQIESLDGEPLRRLAVPGRAGFHRLAWDLRLPDPDPIRLEPPGPLLPWEEPPFGPLVAPGTYVARLLRVAGDRVEAVGEVQPFEVSPLPGETAWDGVEDVAMEAKTRTEHGRRTLDALRRATAASALLEETLEALAHLREAAVITPGVGKDVLEPLAALDAALADLAMGLGGDTTRSRRAEPTEPSTYERLLFAAWGSWLTTQAPTRTQIESTRIAIDQLDEIVGQLDSLRAGPLRQVEQGLAAAGAPFTPGRSMFPPGRSIESPPSRRP